MYRNRLITAALSMTLVAGVVAGCGGAKQTAPAAGQNQAAAPASAKKDLGTVRVGYLPASHDTLLFVGLEKGYFSEFGLKVEPFAFKSSGEILEAMKAGKLDVGIPGVAAPVMFIAGGADFKMVGGAAWFSAMVVARPDNAEQFKTMKDYKGKTVGTVRLATGDITWRWGLKQAGLDPAKDVTVKEFGSPGDAMAALKAKQLDAAVLWEPYGTLAEAQGLKIISWTKEIYPHPCCRQVFTTEYEGKNPDAVVAYLKGTIKASQFFNDEKNKDESLTILKKYLKMDEAHIKATIIDKDPTTGQLRTTVSPALGIEDVKEYAKMMQSIGYINDEGRQRVEKSVDATHIVKAYKELGLAKTDEEALKLAGQGLGPAHKQGH